MSIQKITDFPLISTPSFKIFLVDPVGPVLALKSDTEGGYFQITLTFNVNGIRIDKSLSWNIRKKTTKRRDSGKEEETRDDAFDKMGQEAVESEVRELYKILTDKEGEHEDA